MVHRPNCFPVRLAGLLVAVLVTTFGSLALAPPAAARVSIVPDTVRGGGTETFAFRLANERSDTTSNRLELVFPHDVPIAFVEVVPVRGWTATITPRPLDPPVRVGDRVIDEVVGSIVLAGGPVGPRQFEPFLITMGPLPAGGRMVFEATQTFGDGAVERWTSDGGRTTPGAPVIVIDSGTAPGAPPPPVAADLGTPPPGPADRPQAREVGDDTNSGLLVGALGLGAAIIALVGFWEYRRRRPTPAPAAKALPTSEPDDVEQPNAVEVVDR
ncbi:DUF1775 domain-containing protein [Saccharopolyspora sp. K220]|uniref:DUF1775 domain-containing protein n=1 Tax=Saccharopolyspora soli TaxID=2926618 RepID=UPI001F59DFBA|nr:DUF1775 domain-containing protein [Saccharopolyspora soli]MCI2415849.1 DUF1775 domain-containing protein [Saccharopolyspora soli]